MPIAAADIEPRLSGGATNTVADDSIGGAMSTVGGGVITTDVKNNLIGDISSAEASSGIVLFRGYYYQNAHGSLTYQGPVIWISQQTTSGDTSLDIAIADEAVNVAIETLANETTVPATVVFTAPASKGAGLTLGDLLTTEFRGMWVRYTVNAAAAAFADQFQIDIEGDTAP